MAYRFIEENQPIFGIRWLLRRLGIHPNAYYNYLKHRKSAYYAQKEQIKEQIRAIYHAHGGVDGYRPMKVYLERRNIKLSVRTVHRYMNTEMGLMPVVRRKRPGYQKSKPHKVFRNILEQDFSCDEINTKWCTDHKGNQNDQSKLACGKIDQARDQAHQKHGSRFLNLRAHQQERDSRKERDQPRHQDPEQGMQATNQHKCKIDDKIECGKNTDGDQISPFQHLPTVCCKHSFILLIQLEHAN